MSGLELPGEPAVERQAACVEPGERDRTAMRTILGLDGVERGHTRCIPDLGMRKVDRNLRGVGGVGEPLDEIVAGAEEKRAVHEVTNRLPVRAGHALDPDDVAAFRAKWGLDERPLLVCVSRLVPDLKAEGIFTAIEATVRSNSTRFSMPMPS